MNTRKILLIARGSQLQEFQGAVQNWPCTRRARRDWREASPAHREMAVSGAGNSPRRVAGGVPAEQHICLSRVWNAPRSRKWALMRLRPEGLSTTCPLTAARWKMAPAEGGRQITHSPVREQVRKPFICWGQAPVYLRCLILSQALPAITVYCPWAWEEKQNSNRRWAQP